MLLAGLYANAPRVEETVYHLARLRALRVETDVGLATGLLSVADATAYLERAVPVSAAEAAAEVAARLAAPGQGLSYVLGKAELLAFLEASREAASTAPPSMVSDPPRACPLPVTGDTQVTSQSPSPTR